MAKTAGSLHYTFYTAPEYWDELIKRIDQTKEGDRVAFMTMDFFPTDPIIKKVLQAAQRATERKVQVRLLVDSRPLLFEPRSARLGPLWYKRALTNLKKPFKQPLKAVQTINDQPTGQGAIINKPSRRFVNPFAGRSHIKISLVNDEVFIGSCNLQGEPFFELMVSWQDTRTADYLYNFMHDVMETGHVGRTLDWHDQQFKLTDTASLLIDAGKRGQSTILETTLKLIDEAKKQITITCQFFPNGVTAQHLTAAYKRGVNVRILFTPPVKHGKLAFLQYFALWREKVRLPAALFSAVLPDSELYLHTKLLVTDAGTLIGSHNYIRTGVRLGTAEIALLNHDPVFGQAALDALERDLAQ